MCTSRTEILPPSPAGPKPRLLHNSSISFSMSPNSSDRFSASRAFFASKAHSSIVPPKPIPTVTGGQAEGPFSLTVLTTKSTMPCFPSYGLSIANLLAFSEPPPLGVTVSVILSPSTICVWIIAGVLVFVFVRSTHECRTDGLKWPSLYPLRCSSFIAS